MIKLLNTILLMGIFMMSMISVTSESSELNFKIYHDSNEINEVELKNQIIDIYLNMVAHVDDSSKSTLVLQHLDDFKLNADTHVELQYDTIVITVGDGQGTLISGGFESSMCQVEIQQESFIAELFSW